MKIKAANGFARILKAEGIPWVSCYPTNHVNNALGEEGVPILMMGEERFAVAVADAFSRVTCGKQIGVCTVMANLNAAGIQMAYGAIGQAWEDSSPLLVIVEGVGQGASRHTHYDMDRQGGVVSGRKRSWSSFVPRSRRTALRISDGLRSISPTARLSCWTQLTRGLRRVTNILRASSTRA